MVIIKKLELALDLTRPAEELIEAIITVLEMLGALQPKENSKLEPAVHSEKQ
ncbi:hypothetical protein [Paenibacillus odorifer]|uniref:hypothetical protein n=1 Tax=Paenibacillus odorifer TaxID=189426 RepID=UPI0015C2E155|nr:hypothetical protein [Paenibacillus odorifer]